MVELMNPFDEAVLTVNVKANVVRNSIVVCKFAIAVDGLVEQSSVTQATLPAATDSFPLSMQMTTEITGTGRVELNFVYQCSRDAYEVGLAFGDDPSITATVSDASTIIAPDIITTVDLIFDE